MTYKVLIVDDEPPAIRSIRRILDRYGANFEVVGEAFNGVDALEAIERLHPDLVFTDLKMPAMDGITLIKQVNSRFPEIITIIVSGYDDFQYAREAMKTTAAEYLLKPVAPEMIIEVLESISIKLEEACLTRGQLLLDRAILQGEQILEPDKSRLFPGKYFSVGLLRCGGLRRNSWNGVGCGTANVPLLRKAYGKNRIWTLKGRDHQEEYILITGDDEKEVEEASISIFEEACKSPIYVTYVHSMPFTSLNDLQATAKQAVSAMEHSLIVGKKQRLLLDVKTDASVLLDDTTLGQTEYYMQSRMMPELRAYLIKALKGLESDSITQAGTEQVFNQLLLSAQKFLPGFVNSSTDMQMNDIFLEARDMNEVILQFLELLESILEEDSPKLNVQRQALFEKITAYIRRNLSAQIMIQDLCAAFQLSQPTISRLFREYQGMSFCDFLTGLRIDKAKELLSGTSMLLWEIAEMVGYQDQHYFSRKFRQVTGISPSQYREQSNHGG